VTAGAGATAREFALYRAGRWLKCNITIADTTNAAVKPAITRAMKTAAANTIAAISRNHVRVLKPRDAAFNGGAFEA
jgi:hypothetical protein